MAHQNFYFGDGKKKAETIIEELNIKDTIEKARSDAKKVEDLSNKVEDISLQIDIRRMVETANKIINAVEKNPKKYNKVSSFFEYYLPAAINILNKYDEIENQRLISNDSKRFMEQARKIISELEKALEKQLASMYQNDIVDTDAEIKVLDMMLKSEGLNSNNIDQN